VGVVFRRSVGEQLKEWLGLGIGAKGTGIKERLGGC